MGHVDPDTLGEAEIVYLAASLREAQQVEAMLTGHGVNYAVQVESLGRTTLFGTPRQGAGFYVASAQADACRSLLERSGFARVVADQPDRTDR
jgi:hypothetical protein